MIELTYTTRLSLGDWLGSRKARGGDNGNDGGELHLELSWAEVLELP